MQGRYIISSPTTTNFKDLYNALQKEFPSIEFAVQDDTEVQTVYDTSKVIQGSNEKCWCSYHV